MLSGSNHFSSGWHTGKDKRSDGKGNGGKKPSFYPLALQRESSEDENDNDEDDFKREEKGKGIGRKNHPNYNCADFLSSQSEGNATKARLTTENQNMADTSMDLDEEFISEMREMMTERRPTPKIPQQPLPLYEMSTNRPYGYTVVKNPENIIMLDGDAPQEFFPNLFIDGAVSYGENTSEEGKKAFEAANDLWSDVTNEARKQVPKPTSTTSAGAPALKTRAAMRRRHSTIPPIKGILNRSKAPSIIGGRYRRRKRVSFAATKKNK